MLVRRLVALLVILGAALSVTAALAQDPAANGEWTLHTTGNQLIYMAIPSNWTITEAGNDAISSESPDGASTLAFGGVFVEGGLAPDAFLTQTCDPASYVDDITTVTEIGVVDLPVGGTTCRVVLDFNQVATGVFYFILYGGEVVLTISGTGDALDEAQAADVTAFVDHAAATFSVRTELADSQWTGYANADASFWYSVPPGWEMLGGGDTSLVTTTNFDTGAIVTVSAVTLNGPLDITLAAADVEASYADQGGTVYNVDVVNRSFGDAVRLVGRMPVFDVQDAFNGQLQYVFVRGDQLYFMTASAPEGLFDDLLWQFEQIFATFGAA